MEHSRLKYQMLIQWSEVDQAYVVGFPEFGPHCHTHGDSYSEAAKNGEAVLKLLVADYEQRGNLPQPNCC